MKKLIPLLLALAVLLCACGDDPAAKTKGRNFDHTSEELPAQEGTALTPAESVVSTPVGGIDAADGVVIPDVYEVDEQTAKNVIFANGLIPAVKYDYNGAVAEGNVFKTEPAIGNEVAKNTKITLYVSLGPAYIEAVDGNIYWYSISEYYEDDWQFYAPYIVKDVLYIECEVCFGVDMEWSDDNGTGSLLGIASLTDGFEKTVPIYAEYQKQRWDAYEWQSFTLEIPLKDFDIRRPTDIYTLLYTNHGEVSVDFYMTW